MRRSLFYSLGCLVLVTACASPPATSPDFEPAAWQSFDGSDAYYLIGPGDTVDINVVTAPELSRSLTISPDGRLRMPLIGPVAAAGKTVEEIEISLMQAYARELNDPRLDIIPTGFASQQVFVGGAVGQPGLVQLPGQIGPLQAIIMAGGFTEESDTKQVLLIRRAPGGTVKSALFDIHAGLRDPELANWGPLQRFDVVYVSRTWIAQENLFVQQYIRDALPVDFSIFYDISDSGIF